MKTLNLQKSLILLIGIFYSTLLLAQPVGTIEMDVEVLEPAPNSISDIFNAPNNLQITWNYTGTGEIVALAVTLTGTAGQANNLLLTYNDFELSIEESIGTQTFQSGINLEDLIGEITELNPGIPPPPPSIGLALSEQGVLAPGEYELCVEVTRVNMEIITDCTSFTVEESFNTGLQVVPVMNDQVLISMQENNITVTNDYRENQETVDLANVFQEIKIEGMDGNAQGLQVSFPLTFECELDLEGLPMEIIPFQNAFCPTMDVPDYNIQGGSTAQRALFNSGSWPTGNYQICQTASIRYQSVLYPLSATTCQTVEVIVPLELEITTGAPTSNLINQLTERPNLLTIRANNISTTPLEDVRMQLQITGTSGLANNLVTTLPDLPDLISNELMPGINTFTGMNLEDLFGEISGDDLNTNAVGSGLQRRFLRSGYLPTGNYNFCVQAYRGTGNNPNPLSDQICATYEVEEPISFSVNSMGPFDGSIQRLLSESGLLSLDITNDALVTTEDLEVSLVIKGPTGVGGQSIEFNFTSDEITAVPGLTAYTGMRFDDLFNGIDNNLFIQNATGLSTEQETSLEQGQLPNGVYEFEFTLNRRLVTGQRIIGTPQSATLTVDNSLELEITVNNNIGLPIRSPNQLFDNSGVLAVQISNSSMAEINDLAFQLVIRGPRDQGMNLLINAPVNTGLLTESDVLISPGMGTYRVEDLIPGSFWVIVNSSPLQEKLLTQESALFPDGNYDVQLLGFTRVNENDWVQRYTSNLESFTVENTINPPDITQIGGITDLDGIVEMSFNEDNDFIFNLNWNLLDFNNNDIVYNPIFKILPLSVQQDLTTIDSYQNDDLFNYLESVPGQEDTIRVERTLAYQHDGSLNFEEDKIYAVRITASSPTVNFNNDGYSQIVFFTFKDTEPDVKIIDESVVVIENKNYPQANDTLPFTVHPYIVNINQDTSYRFFDFYQHVQKKMGDDYADFGDYIIYHGDNDWKPDGPLEFARKRDGIGIKDAAQAYQFRVNDKNYTLERGQQYGWKFNSTLTREDDSEETNEFMIDYVIGMPMPRLDYPGKDSKVQPGKINLIWKTGNTPKKLMPLYQTVRAEGTKGSVEEEIFSDVKERYVVQISSDSIFTDVKEAFSGTLVFNDPQEETDDRNKYIPSNIASAIYKPMNDSTTITQTGDYFWRVVYLSEPGLGENDTNFDYKNIDSDDFYRSSPVNKFTITDEIPIDTATASCACDFVLADRDIVEQGLQSAANYRYFKMGHFKVRVDEESLSKSGNMISGTGLTELQLQTTVFVKVKFENVQLNKSGQAVSGTVSAVEDTGPLQIGEFMPTGSSEQSTMFASKLDELLKESGDHTGEARLLGRMGNSNPDKPIGLPLGINEEVEGFKILTAFTEMTFEPTRAKTTFAVEVTLPKELYDGGANNKFAIAASDICISTKGLGPEYTLNLSDDLVIPLDNSEFLRIKGNKTDPEKATHFKMDCEGFRSASLRVEVEFPKDVVIPDVKQAPDDSVVKGTFALTVQSSRAKDFGSATAAAAASNLGLIAEFSMTPFEFTALKGFGFTLNEGYIDWSDNANPENITFPSNYKYDTGGDQEGLKNTWKGIYLKELSVRLPNDLVKDENASMDKFEAGIRNFIFDGQFTGEAFATNIISIDDGAVNGWALSVDTFSISVTQNTFSTGKLNGKIRLPVQDTSGYVQYNAVLGHQATSEESEESDSEWGLVLTVEVKEEPIKIPMMVAEAVINENSYVHLQMGKVEGDSRSSEGNSFMFDGEINIGGDNLDGAGEAIGKIATAMDFKGMKFRTKYTQTSGWDQDSTYFKLASPQKYLANSFGDEEDGGVGGFPITIKNFKVENLDSALATISDGKGEIAGKFSFDIALNLMGEGDGGFKATSSMSFKTGWDMDNSHFILDKFAVGCIEVDTEANGVGLEGKVCFYKDGKPGCPAMPAEGISGNLAVTLPMAKVALAAEFGVAKKTDGTDFRYWSVDGKAIISGGLSMGTVSLYGLSGGVYYNMSPQTTTKNVNGQEIDATLVAQANSMVQEDITANQTSADSEGNKTNTQGEDSEEPDLSLPVESSGLKFCPSEGAYFFKAGLVMGITGEPSTFNMDVGVSVGIKKDVGLSYFSIVGNGYIMADFNEREKAPLIADIIIKYARDNCENIVTDEIPEQLCDQSFKAEINIYLDIAYPEEDAYLVLRGATPDQTTFAGIENRSLMVKAGFYMDDLKRTDPTYSFKMGSYFKPSVVRGKLLDNIKLSALFYLQAGDNIDVGMMKAQDWIQAILDKPEGSSEQGSIDQGQTISSVDQFLPDKPVSGFTTGFQLDTQIEVDFAIIYASLRAGFGFDFNLFKNPNGSYCQRTVRGLTTTMPAGENGYYSTGQIYGGIEGEVGIRIPIIDKEVSLFTLGAAFIVEGGFPSPTWAKGTAALSYDVLGLVKGKTRFDFQAGEVCIPPNTDPFGFSIIEEIIPSDGETNIKLDANPEVSFSIPFDDVQRFPIIENVDGKVVKRDWVLLPYVAEATISKGNEVISSYRYTPPANYGTDADQGMATKNRASIYFPEEDDNRRLIYFNEAELEENTDYEFKITLRASELKNGRFVSAKVIDPKNPDLGLQDWKHVESVKFKTGILPDNIPYSSLLATTPLPKQNYFLPDDSKEISLVFKKKTIAEKYFKNKKLPKSGREVLDYYARFIPLAGGEQIIAPYTGLKSTSVGASGTSLAATFQKPVNLQNETVYLMQIVAKTKPLPGFTAGPFTTGPLTIVSSDIAGSNTTEDPNPTPEFSFMIQQNENYEDLSANNPTASTNAVSMASLAAASNSINFGQLNQDNFIADIIRLDPSKVRMDLSEFVMLDLYFKTSKYNSMEEKLQTGTVINTGQLMITTDEKFDVFDLYGLEKPELLTDYPINTQGGYPKVKPLINIKAKPSTSLPTDYLDGLAKIKKEVRTFTKETGIVNTRWSSGFGCGRNDGWSKGKLLLEPKTGLVQMEHWYNYDRSDNKWKQSEKLFSMQNAYDNKFDASEKAIKILNPLSDDHLVIRTKIKEVVPGVVVQVDDSKIRWWKKVNSNSESIPYETNIYDVHSLTKEKSFNVLFSDDLVAHRLDLDYRPEILSDYEVDQELLKNALQIKTTDTEGNNNANASSNVSDLYTQGPGLIGRVTQQTRDEIDYFNKTSFKTKIIVPDNLLTDDFQKIDDHYDIWTYSVINSGEFTWKTQCNDPGDASKWVERKGYGVDEVADPFFLIFPFPFYQAAEKIDPQIQEKYNNFKRLRSFYTNLKLSVYTKNTPFSISQTPIKY